MKDSNKNWEEQMKQILDEQEIVFEETDWKAAQALIQAANLHIPAENKKRRGLGWFWTVLVGGILLGYMVGSGHFSTPKLAAKNESFSQVKTIQKGENVPFKETIQKNNIPIANSTPQNTFSPTKTQKTKAFSSQNEPIFLTENSQKDAIQMTIKPTNQDPFFTENIAQEAPKQLVFIPQPETISTNKGVTAILKRNPSLQKIAYQDSPIIKDKNLIINPLKSQNHKAFFAKTRGYAYAGAAYQLLPSPTATFYGGVKMAYQIAPHFLLTVSGNYSERRVSFVNGSNMANMGISITPSNADTIPDFTNISTTAPITANATVVTTEAIYLRAARYIGGGIGISIPYQRHAFFADINYHHLLNTQSKYTINITENQSLIYQDSKNISSFVAGINKTDISIGIGYQYTLTRKIQLQIAVNKGFKDMSNDNFYQNEVKHRNIQVQTGIVYRLF